MVPADSPPALRRGLLARLERSGARIGFVPRLVISLLVAVGLAVAIVDAWTAGVIARAAEEQSSRQLDLALAVLKLGLRPLGVEWRGDGETTLSLGGTELAGRNDIVDGVRDVTGATATIMAGTTRIATTVPRPDGLPAIGTKLAAGPAQAALATGHSYRGRNTILGRSYATIYEPVRDAAGRQVGALYVGLPLAAIDAEAAALLHQALLVGGTAAVGIALLGWWALRGTTRPLLLLAAEMRAIAGGALSRPVPLTGRGDQIGQMARALDQLREGARRARLADADSAARRDRREADKQAALTDMAGAITTQTANVVLDVERGTTSVTGAAAAIAASASRSAEEAEQAGRATDTALRNAQAVAGAAGQLSASINAITAQVAQSAEIVAGAVETGHAARRVIETLTEQVARVGTVATMIAHIAERTDLLALNAAIEAARAGDAGRGFAVVANEVKALANQTARSTDEIAGHITEVRAATGEAAEAMARIEARIASIDGIAAAIASAVEHQGSATASIARDIGDTAGAMHEAARSIGLVTEEVRRTRAQAGDVHGHVDQLVASVTALRDAVTHALSGPIGGASANLRAA